MTSFSMAPLFRQSIGFDRFNDLFESALRNDANGSFPPTTWKSTAMISTASS